MTGKGERCETGGGSRVEILSLGKSKAACTPRRWAEIFASFDPKARYHAANLAAHNWDVLLVGGRVFLSCYYGFSAHWLNSDATREDATDEEMGALYERNPQGWANVRRFSSIPELVEVSRDADERCLGVHEELKGE